MKNYMFQIQNAELYEGSLSHIEYVADIIDLQLKLSTSK